MSSSVLQFLSCAARIRAGRIVAMVLLGIVCGGAGRADAVGDLVKAQLARQKIPGAAVAVLQSGKIVKLGAYGVADTERGVAVTDETVFRILSVSKSITATAVMMLVEEGKIGLDDPIRRHLVDSPETWRNLTVRHLLAQTSGLRDFINEPTIDLRQEATEAQLVASVAQQPLKFEPGSAWDYSNTNYLLLGLIIRQASGQPYAEFLAERIFRPLEMTSTAVVGAGEKNRLRAKGYTLDKGRTRAGALLPQPLVSYAGGGIESTAADLAKWDAALDAERLLKRATLEQMWTPVTLNNGTTAGYGLGWEIGVLAQHRRVSHAGKWTGFSAQIDRFPDDGLTVIVLTNLAEAAPARLSRAIAAVYIPALATPVYQPIADNEPKVTARLLEIVRRTQQGGLEAEEFTAPVWAYLEPRLAQVKHDFGSFGPIQSLTLVERTDKDDERNYRYRARFSRTSMIFHFVLTKDDRIAAMMPEQVNQ